jgi:hypothetical protein
MITLYRSIKNPQRFRQIYVACPVQHQCPSFGRSTINRGSKINLVCRVDRRLICSCPEGGLCGRVSKQTYLLQYLFTGKVGVRAFCDRLDVLINYMTFFPPFINVHFTTLTEQELQAVLHDAPPPRVIQNMKESNQQPLRMNVNTLRSFALIIENRGSCKTPWCHVG